jgi:hypothetical protein
VISIFLKQDLLFSGSYDGSVKMWTTIRAVELKSFKSFDDGVTIIQITANKIFFGMSNQLIELSEKINQIETIKSFESLVIGIIEITNGILIAGKTIDSIKVYHIQDHTYLTSIFEIRDSCSSYYTESDRLEFWFGLRDGSIILFKAEVKTFNTMVFLQAIDLVEF